VDLTQTKIKIFENYDINKNKVHTFSGRIEDINLGLLENINEETEKKLRDYSWFLVQTNFSLC